MGAAESVIARVFEYTAAYRLTQALFAEQKLRPVLESPDYRRARRVLDVGCGPGTNTPHFDGKEYLGVDVNPGYIAYARRRYGREFTVADVTTYRPPDGTRFDLVLANSFFHHLDDGDVRRVLVALAGVVSDDGYLHVIDLVLPERTSIARTLALLDRGRHPRPVGEWKRLFGERFAPVSMTTFDVGLFGVTLWKLVHFCGRPAR
jgi:SAM-dependent methyltransferase